MLERDDSPEKVKKRILNDREVFKDVIKKVDYIIVNKDLNETVNEIVSITVSYTHLDVYKRQS